MLELKIAISQKDRLAYKNETSLNVNFWAREANIDTEVLQSPTVTKFDYFFVSKL